MNALYRDNTLNALLSADESAAHELIEWAVEYGICSDIYKSYISYALIKLSLIHI